MDKISNGFKSLFLAAKNASQGIDQYVAEDTKNQRKAICEGCPKLSVIRQCGECLCFVDLKTTLKQEKCPLNLWLKDE